MCHIWFLKILKKIVYYLFRYLIIKKGLIIKVISYIIVYDKKQFTSYKNKKISLGSLPARYIKIECFKGYMIKFIR